MPRARATARALDVVLWRVVSVLPGRQRRGGSASEREPRGNPADTSAWRTLGSRGTRGAGSAAVGGPLRLHTAVLPGAEGVHAGVVGVVHEVVNRVDAAGGAGVPAGRALIGRRGLGRGVGDVVTRARATALERVVE